MSRSDDDQELAVTEGRQLLLEMVHTLHQAGARILLGTDEPNFPMMPGFSVHRELSVLVEAGLTLFEALRAGTRDAAEYLGTLDQSGTVAAGRRADLILLDSNPLVDVADVADRAGRDGAWSLALSGRAAGAAGALVE